MSLFYCRDCGKRAERYAPSCPSCGATNALQEGTPRDGGWVRASGGAQLLHEVERRDVDRIETGTRELDRVLGGGFALEGIYSLSGSPGAGKSTLLAQVMGELCAAEVGEGDEPWKVLYVAAEELKEQVAARLDRVLGEVARSGRLQFWLVNENDPLEIEKVVVQHDVDVIVIDSINTMTMKEEGSQAGTVGAIKACAVYLCGLAKARRACMVLVGHVNKDDELAGPKMYEHLVDGVLHLSNEEPFRVLRASKHRFAPTSEVGIFVMKADGLRSVENPSELLLEGHGGGPGSVVGVVAEGEEGATRALLCEVQAMHVPGERGMGFSVTGLDERRVRQNAVVAMTQLGAPLLGENFVSVAGGLKPRDVGLDLPVALAMLSAALGEEMPEGLASFGEMGLLGELRRPKSAEGRVKSALAMHVDFLMTPPLEEPVPKDVEHVVVRSLAEAVAWLGWDLAPKRGKKSRRKRDSTRKEP